MALSQRSSLPLLALAVLTACGGGGGGSGPSAPTGKPRQEPGVLVTDLDQRAEGRGSSPSSGVAFAGRFFFAMERPGTGYELFRTDGTESGTELVRDIQPGSVGSNPSVFRVVGNKLFFSAETEAGRELWMSDGTKDGTVMVADLVPGPTSADPFPLAVDGDALLFSYRDPEVGRELFRTDGTTVSLVKDINPGKSQGDRPLDSDIRRLVRFQNRFFFQASTEASGEELFVTDGTPRGTRMLKEIAPGTRGSRPGNFAVFGGKLYFQAFHPSFGRELWATNGTEQGTALVVDLRSGTGSSSPQSLFPFGDVILFNAFGATGRELYKTDGTAAGTVLVKDIKPGTINDSGSPSGFTALGNIVVFRADDGEHGSELWRTDGTPAGTTLLKDLEPGSRGSNAFSFRRLDEVVLFRAETSAIGAEIWASDGTARGTVPVLDIFPGRGADGAANSSDPFIIGAFAGQAAVRADNGTNGSELWFVTALQARLLNLVADGTRSSRPSGLTKAGDRVLFAGSSPETGFELFETDGTAAGTSVVRDIRVGSDSASVSNLTPLGDRFVFTATSETAGREPFITDGTTAGTRLLLDIDPSIQSGRPRGSNAQEFTQLGTKVLFGANDGTRGQELWITDGTATGTTLVADLDPRTSSRSRGNSGNPQNLVRFDGRVFFTATAPDVGRELFVTDGTTAGTSLFTDHVEGGGSSEATPLGVAGGRLVFVAQDASRGAAIFSTNGTKTDIVRLGDAPRFFSGPRALATLGNRLLIDLRGDLTVTDGIKDGTKVLKEFRGIQSFRNAAIVLGSFAYFSADDGEHGTELWRTDGTTEGTTLVTDLYPGTLPSRPAALFSPDGTVGFFVAQDVEHGRELFQVNADGAVELVFDFRPGPADGAIPAPMIELDGRLLLLADDGRSGAELFRIAIRK